jgi:hypothetical protein
LVYRIGEFFLILQGYILLNAMNFPIVHLKGCTISENHTIINYILSQHKLFLGKIQFEEGTIFNKTIRAIKIGDTLRIGDQVPNHYSTIITELIKIILDSDKGTKTIKEMSIATLMVAFAASRVIDEIDVEDIVFNIHKDGRVLAECNNGIVSITICEKPVPGFTKSASAPIPDTKKSVVVVKPRAVEEPQSALPEMKVVSKKKAKKSAQEFEQLTFAKMVQSVDEQRDAYGGWYLKHDGKKVTITNGDSFIPITFSVDTCVGYIHQYRKQPASLKHVTNCKYATCSFPHDIEKCDAALKEHEEFIGLIQGSEMDVKNDLYCRLLRINFKKITGIDIYGDWDSLLTVADKIPKKFHMNEETHKKALTVTKKA